MNQKSFRNQILQLPNYDETRFRPSAFLLPPSPPTSSHPPNPGRKASGSCCCCSRLLGDDLTMRSVIGAQRISRYSSPPGISVHVVSKLSYHASYVDS